MTYERKLFFFLILDTVTFLAVIGYLIKCSTFLCYIYLTDPKIMNSLHLLMYHFWFTIILFNATFVIAISVFIYT